MFNILPLVLILVSLVIIIIIVTRKFSVLANLDVNTIQSEREAKFKEQIVGKRLKRNFVKYYSRLARLFGPIKEYFAKYAKQMFDKLLEYKESYKKEKQKKGSSPKDDLNNLFAEAEVLSRNEEYARAEEKYIEVIAADSKNVKAFCGLGGVYFARKDFVEARQTLEHAQKLLESKYGSQDNEAEDDINAQLSGVYFELARICQASEDRTGLYDYLKKSLKIEPNNPRYLDMFLNISIIDKDKGKALDAYERLSRVNPDNQKLNDFKKQIDEL